MIAGLRTLLIAGVSSLGLVVYLVLWFHWPVVPSLGVGVVMAILVVLTSASLGADAAEADAAWRAAAPDLVDRWDDEGLQAPGRDRTVGLDGGPASRTTAGASSAGTDAEAAAESGVGAPGRHADASGGDSGGIDPDPAAADSRAAAGSAAATGGPGISAGYGSGGISSGGGSRR